MACTCWLDGQRGRGRRRAHRTAEGKYSSRSKLHVRVGLLNSAQVCKECDFLRETDGARWQLAQTISLREEKEKEKEKEREKEKRSKERRARVQRCPNESSRIITRAANYRFALFHSRCEAKASRSRSILDRRDFERPKIMGQRGTPARARARVKDTAPRAQVRRLPAAAHHPSSSRVPSPRRPPILVAETPVRN